MLFSFVKKETFSLRGSRYELKPPDSGIKKYLLVVCKVCLKAIILRDNAISKH